MKTGEGSGKVEAETEVNQVIFLFSMHRLKPAMGNWQRLDFTRMGFTLINNVIDNNRQDR
jgi:hypothetical protein